MSQKLDIRRELQAVDHKNYDFYSNLSDEEKKAFSPYVLMRFTSNVKGSFDIQEWFLEQTNEFVNKNHWQLSKNHKELLWKLYAATGIGQPLFHQYLAASKKSKNDPIENILLELYPSMKLDDVKTWVSLMSLQDKVDLLDSMGFSEREKRDYL